MRSEYDEWVEYFKQPDFVKNLNVLESIYAGKKVIIYCNGIYFDALTDVFKLRDFFDIKGVSDIRYENSKEEEYKGFRVFKPDELSEKVCDIILVASPNYQNIKKFLSSKNINLPVLPLHAEISALSVKDNYTKVLEKIKHKEKIRILFTCEENTKWSYSRLYKLLLSNPRFEVLPVLLFPIVTKNRIEFTQKQNEEFFLKEGINTIDGYDYTKEQNRDIKELEPDIVFYQQPWYLFGSNHPEKASKYALTAMVPYGYTTLSPDEWGSEQVKKVYSSLWKFFSESPYHNEFYQKAAGMDEDVLYAAGSLKLDEYRNPEADESFWKGRGKRVIWAPHHSINNDGLRMGTFRENYRFFFEYAKAHQDLSFILKPHPALRIACINSGIDYDSYINEWNSLPNASTYDKGAYFDIFKTSDVLITDCSSFLAEYFPSGKPIIFLNRPDRAPFDEFGNEIKQGFYQSETNSQAALLIEKLLIKNDDNLRNKRVQILKKYFYFPERSSAEIIAGFLSFH